MSVSVQQPWRAAAGAVLLAVAGGCQAPIADDRPVQITQEGLPWILEERGFPRVAPVVERVLSATRQENELLQVTLRNPAVWDEMNFDISFRWYGLDGMTISNLSQNPRSVYLPPGGSQVLTCPSPFPRGTSAGSVTIILENR